MDQIPVLTLGDVLLVSIQVDLEDQLALRLREDLSDRIVSTGAHGVVIDISALDIVDSFIGRMLSTIAAIPVIHVSAAAVQMVDRTQGLSRGADAYLVEPIDPEELLATAQAVLRYYRARQHAERLAGRLAKLTRMAVELNTADDLRRLLGAAAAGTADIFGGPATV
jgi:DNA-binding response OmpR family regulator